MAKRSLFYVPFMGWHLWRPSMTDLRLLAVLRACQSAVVPVAIRGTFELLPKSTLAPHPGRVDVFICAPIDTSECPECDLQMLVEAARSAIAARLPAGDHR
jgi:1-acyl-sn-glycerol-3-phosphate acyltransferase